MSEDLVSTSDIRGTEATGLTVEYVWNIGKAVADWLPTNGSVVVMYGVSEKRMAEAVIEGLRLQGRHVVDGGGGDREAAKKYVTDSGLSGAVVLNSDDAQNVTTVEIYKEGAEQVTAESGLKAICELVESGNFVPAATKGDLTHLA